MKSLRWIGGPCVGRGYLNRPEKNAECFTPNPFCSEAGRDRVYHTGDVVRYLPNGEIDFIGRSDGQVKIRGFRVELSEIEAVIRDYPAIADVTVQAFDNESGSGKYIAAYIVEKEGAQAASGELEAFIRQRKPPYMVPAVIMKLDAIPRTAVWLKPSNCPTKISSSASSSIPNSKAAPTNPIRCSKALFKRRFNKE